MNKEINCREILLNSCSEEIKAWSPISPEQLYKFTPVNLQSKTGRKIDALFNSGCYSLEIIAVDRIENPYLILAYALKKLSLATPLKEYWLFHGTKSKNVAKIARDNFDWRLCTGHLYGEGVSFSNSAWYASFYSDRDVQLKEMLLARVIVTKTTVGTNYMKVPPDGCDASKRFDGKVIVKYDDDTFYPAFRIKYCNKVQANFFKKIISTNNLSATRRFNQQDSEDDEVRLSDDLSTLNNEDNLALIDKFYRLELVRSTNSSDHSKSTVNLALNLKKLKLNDKLSCHKDFKDENSSEEDEDTLKSKDSSESEDNLLYNFKKLGLKYNLKKQKASRGDNSDNKDITNESVANVRIYRERHYADENYNYETRTFNYDDYGYNEKFTLGFYPDTNGYANQYEYEDDFEFDDEYHEEYFYRRWFGDGNSEDDLF